MNHIRHSDRACSALYAVHMGRMCRNLRLRRCQPSGNIPEGTSGSTSLIAAVVRHVTMQGRLGQAGGCSCAHKCPARRDYTVGDEHARFRGAGPGCARGPRGAAAQPGRRARPHPAVCDHLLHAGARRGPRTLSCMPKGGEFSYGLVYCTKALSLARGACGCCCRALAEEWSCCSTLICLLCG